MFRYTSCLAGVALTILAILGLWLWVWNATLARGLSLAFACGLLIYCYLVRHVAPFVRTSRWRYSTLDLFGLIVAFALLAANRRSPDGIVALALWPWTMLVFRWRSNDTGSASRIRRALFWAHATYCGLAMIFSALLSHWLITHWPTHYDRPFETPVFTFLLLPAVGMMSALQQNLGVKLLHPSLIAGIVVSMATAALVATVTSWAISILAFKLRKLR